MNFVVFRAPGKNYQLVSQKLHFPRPKSSYFLILFFNRYAKSQRMHFLSVLTDRVRLPLGYSKGCAPLPDMWKSCVPSCCFMFRAIIIAKVCETFVNFERIFLYEPTVTAQAKAEIRH